MNRIERFEALAEGLVEGTFARLFAGHLHPLEVATHLARALEDHQVTGPDDTPLAPTHYWVYLHPQDYKVLIDDRPSIDEDLVEHVASLAREAGLVLTMSPVVCVEPQEEVPLHSVRVDARWQSLDGSESGNTREMVAEEREAIQAAVDEQPSRPPFIIVDGQRHVELDEPIVSIGRALDNDVILEDSRVSRYHAQLRRRYGRYVLYDLGSSGGTTIGGYPVQECVLQPGDVISFAGVTVIYGEELIPETAEPEEGDTSEMEGDESDEQEGED